jgi:hypothetical protein
MDEHALSQPMATVDDVSTDPYSKLKDPVGTAEIAVRLGVTKDTVMTWGKRGILPKPSVEASRKPVFRQRAWEWATILRWAGTTGHILDERTREEYLAKFGTEAMAPRKGGKLAAKADGTKKPKPQQGRATVVDPLKRRPRKKASFKPVAP